MKKTIIRIIVGLLLAAALTGIMLVLGKDAQADPIQPNWSISNGVITSSENNQVFFAGVENQPEVAGIAVFQTGIEIPEGGTVTRNAEVEIIVDLQEGHNLIFIGNTWGCNPQGQCSGTWVPNPTFAGVENCQTWANGQTTQLECQTGVGGQQVRITGLAVLPPYQPETTQTPYVTVAHNMTSGGGTICSWSGIWNELENQLFLPLVIK